MIPPLRQRFGTLLFALFSLTGQAQSIGPIRFDKLPQDYQLFPRNAQNEGQISVAGRTGEPGWTYLAVQLLRNQQPYSYQRTPLTYTDGVARFAPAPLPIRAEKALYELRVFLANRTDSIQVVTRTNLVAGDVYALTGQSNASAFFREKRTNPYCRTVGKITGTFNNDAYNPADTLWTLSNLTGFDTNVGPMGFAFQQYILDTYGIPTCLVNGAFNWSSMQRHATRTATNPADLSTGYGRMLYRLQKAGVASHVKGFIYRQGETEAYGEGTDWPGYFEQFYKNLKTDLPGLKQLYVFQIDIIDPAVAEAPQVREAQRTLIYKYADVQTVASVGTAGYDGLHYTDEGYEQNGREVARLAGRDFYSSNVPGIDAPNLQQAYFSTPARDEITLVFDAGQRMRWNEQQGRLLLKNFLYLDGQAGAVRTGEALSNTVVLKLNGASQATRLSYLPAMYGPNLPDYPYRGPYLTNANGLRALTIHDVPIAPSRPAETPTLPTPALSATATSATGLRLTWTPVPGAIGYVLEQFTTTAISGTATTIPPNSFYQIGTFGGQTQTEVTGLESGTSYTFRLKAYSRTGESVYATTSVQLPKAPDRPTLQAEATYLNAVRLTWQPVPEATTYTLERRLASETNFLSLTVIVAAAAPAGLLAVSDTLLLPNSRYVYRLRATNAFGDSPVAEADVQTPAALPAPTVVAEATYNDAVRVRWQAVAGATSYRLSRRQGSGLFEPVGTFGSGVTSYSAVGLPPGTLYAFQIQAFGQKTESPISAVAEVQTPARLAAPVLSVSVVYNNALTVQWANVPGATSYRLERKTATEADFQPIGTYPTATTRRDTILLPGTTYLYRIRAFGDRTDSPPASLSAATPALLATPVLSVSAVAFDTLRVGWQAVPGTAYYTLERRTKGESAYVFSRRIDPLTTTFTDAPLLPITPYEYRLTAFADLTRSNPATAEGITLVLLATEPAADFTIWSNPARYEVTLRFGKIISGSIQLADLQGVVRRVQAVNQAAEVRFSLPETAPGTYLIRVESEAGTWVHRLLIL
jgi:hypothetical protein